ncbi:MAG: hypothetical protein AB8C40_08925 [Gammaproteobacteria bacterium]
MNKIFFCLIIFSLCLSGVNAHAETLYVGEKEKYKTFIDVESQIKDGDVLEIAPGIYRECLIFEASNVVIRPKGWPKQEGKVRFQDVTCEDKGIFVLSGDDITVQGIEFVNARVPDYNGAGIRFEGANLLVEDSYFINNEMGVLTGKNLNSKVIVKRSVFEDNGLASISSDVAIGHGLYVGEVASLYVFNSRFVNQKIGHHIKSRAIYNEIVGNKISDGENGTASYSIDISNGGSVLIEGNNIQKGPLSDNLGTAICIACEGGLNESKNIFVRNNEFINDTGREVVFLTNLTSTKERLENNMFKGAKVLDVFHYYP